ncbi:hypothetical protein ACFLS9_07210 [Bacteroidota bacterium]
MHPMYSKKFEFKFSNILLLLFIWLLVGYPLGTLTLVGPVRWAVNYSKSQLWSHSIEDWVIIGIIILLIVISFIIALLLTKRVVLAKYFISKIIILLVPVGLSVLAVWMWMNPNIMISEQEITQEIYGDIQFDFGPYPDDYKMLQLKTENYTAIISLLHNAVVPFEPKLLNDEMKLAEKVGIPLIHVPMLPWVGSNDSSIQKIKNILKEGNGKYYVHCYLGRDRVGVVKNVINQTLGESFIRKDITSVKIKSVNKFERGEIYNLEEGVYLTPYPTDEEFFAFVLGGSFYKVISLLNPDNSGDIPWIEKEQELFDAYQVGFQLMPFEIDPYDPEKILDYVSEIKKMPKPVLIHTFLSLSLQTNIFRKTYETEIPVLPESFFSTSMSEGNVEMVAQNIVIGPIPLSVEFEQYLYPKGIRKIGYLGVKTSVSRSSEIIAEKAGIGWEYVDIGSIDKLKKGGPWYVYSAEFTIPKSLFKDFKSE